MSDYQFGQIVELKSGSPMMTLNSIDGDEAICRWFSGEKLNEYRFPLVGLIPTDTRSLSDDLLQYLIQGPSELHVGQMVTLMSGGPRMIVKSNDGADVLCLWFSGKKPTEKTFPVTSLIPTEVKPLSDRQLQDHIDGANETGT
jgi:uncharacterized protein YodC (DUF2158 family)